MILSSDVRRSADVHFPTPKRAFILVLLALLSVSSCSAPPGEREVRAAYERFAGAVRSGDRAVLERMAPQLLSDPSGAALGSLKALLDADPSYRIRMSGRTRAAVLLSGPSPAVVPFELGPGGEWSVAEEVERRDFIEFIPADR